MEDVPPSLPRKSHKRKEVLRNAAAVLANLIDDPSIAPEEALSRIASLDPDDARHAALALLFQDVLDPAAEHVVLEALAAHGLGANGLRILEYIGDPARPRIMRSRLAGLIASQFPDHVPLLSARLSPDDLRTLPMEAALVDLLGAIAEDPSEAEELVDLIAEAPADGLDPLFAALLRVARDCGFPLSVLAPPLLKEAKLAGLHAPLLEALADEASAASTSILEKAAHDGPSRLRPAAHAALTRHAARRAAKLCSSTPASSAWVSACDGQGAFVIVVTFGPGPAVGLANLFLTTEGEARDGTFTPRISMRDADAMRRAFEDQLHVPLLAVRASELAALVERLVGGGRVSLPPSASVALAALRGVPDEALVPIAEGPPPRVADLLPLLDTPAYESWFFDDTELPLPPPPSGEPDERWFGTCARKLERTVKRRLFGMAHFHAWFHARRGEPREAALLAAAASQLDREFASAPLVRAMLERTLHLAGL